MYGCTVMSFLPDCCIVSCDCHEIGNFSFITEVKPFNKFYKLENSS